MSAAYIFSRTLTEFREASVHAMRPVRGLAWWLVRAAKVARRYLPGVRCEAASSCIARGGWSVARYDGDTGGGYSVCRLHAEHNADALRARGENARVIEHDCNDACDHATESEWT